MATFDNGENLGSVRLKINQAITQAENAQPVRVVTVDAGAAVTLTAAMNGGLLHLTNAAPTVNIATNATEPLPANFTVQIASVNGGTLQASAGVTLGGSDGASGTITALPALFTVYRTAQDAFFLAGGGEAAAPAPALTSLTLTGGTETLDASVTTDTAGAALYLVVVAGGATAPNAAQIAAGNNASDSAAIASVTISAGAVVSDANSFAQITGLTGATYDVYVAQGSTVVSGGVTVSAANIFTASIADFGIDGNIHDTQRAFGSDRLDMALPTITTVDASDGTDIEVRTVRADNGDEVHGWRTVGTLSSGALTGARFVVETGARSVHSLRLQARPVSSLATPGQTTNTFKAGTHIGLVGQSGTTRTIVENAETAFSGPGLDLENTVVTIGSTDYGVGSPGDPIVGVDITRGTAGGGAGSAGAPMTAHMIDVLRQNGITEPIALTELSASGTGLVHILDDASNRRPIEYDQAVLDAAGWNDDARPGILVWDWWVTDGDNIGIEYDRLFRAAVTGKNPDTGVTLALGDTLTLSDQTGSIITQPVDYLLFDVTGGGRGLFDQTRTKLSFCWHYYGEAEENIGVMPNGLTRGDDGRWRGEQIANEALRSKFYTSIMADADLTGHVIAGPNAYSVQMGEESPGDNWLDTVHPYAGEPEGQRQFARWLAYVAADAAGVVAQVRPVFDEADWAADFSTVTFGWSGGDITRWRDIQGLADPVSPRSALYSEVDGFEVNNVPAQAIIVDDAGNPATAGKVRVTIPASLGITDWSQARVFLHRGSGGWLEQNDLGLDGIWRNRPGVDPRNFSIAATVDPGTALTAFPVDVLPYHPTTQTALVPPEYLSSSVVGRDAWFTSPASIQVVNGGVSATKLRFEADIALEDMRIGYNLFSVGSRVEMKLNQGGQIVMDVWGTGGGGFTSSTALMTPGVRHKIAAVLDLENNLAQLYVDDMTTPAATGVAGSNAGGNFVNADVPRLLNTADGASQGIRLWRVALYLAANGGDIDLATATPAKEVLASSGAATLNADAWKAGAGNFT